MDGLPNDAKVDDKADAEADTNANTGTNAEANVEADSISIISITMVSSVLETSLDLASASLGKSS